MDHDPMATPLFPELLDRPTVEDQLGAMFANSRATRGAMANTRLNYMYRDASNYKQAGSAVFGGTVSPERYQQFVDALPKGSSGEPEFVPEQVGLADLKEEMGGSYEDDNGWHEVLGVEETSELPDRNDTFEEFIARCLAIKVWDDDPRIPHDVTILSVDGDEPGTPTVWVQRSHGEWHARTEPEDGYESRPITSVPESGALVFRRTAAMREPSLYLYVEPTPGSITLTAEEIRKLTGRVLTSDQLTALHLALTTDPSFLGALVDTL